MSNLKSLSVEQLEHEERACREFIGKLKGKLNNMETRLTWIKKYLQEKKPVEMTQSMIEVALGCKIKIIPNVVDVDFAKESKDA